MIIGKWLFVTFKMTVNVTGNNMPASKHLYIYNDLSTIYKISNVSYHLYKVRNLKLSRANLDAIVVEKYAYLCMVILLYIYQTKRHRY